MLFTPKRKAKLYKALRFTRVPGLPHTVGIETGNICNLKCPLCPTGTQDPSMERGFMSLKFFQKIIDEVGKSASSLNLYSWGEPLLNRELPAMIRYAKSVNPGVKIVTSTNLNIRDEAFLKDFIASGIDEVIVSCDGVDQETYSKYRSGGDFALVMHNMQLLLSEAKSTNPGCRVVWNYLVFRHNESKVEEAKKIAGKIGVELRIGKMRTTMKDEVRIDHSEAVLRDKDWIPDNPDYSAYDKEKLAPKKRIKTCRKPWQEISINWDGKVFPCCAVYGDKYNFGSCREKTVRSVWNGEMFIAARKEIQGKKESAALRTICGLCRSHGYMHM